MARFKTVFLVLAILAGVLGIGSVVASSLLTRNAVYAQRAEKLEAAELFGDNQQNTLIGNPQIFLALPEKAFMEGTGDKGAKLIDETYLKQNNIYPIQVKTVEFIRNVLLVISLLGGLLMLFLWRTASRSSAKLIGS